MTYDARAAWTSFYLRKRQGWKTYPNEFLVRIFMGSQPLLDLDKSRYTEQRLCDLGCGDGRNLVLFHQLGLRAFGVEISEEIASWTRRRLAQAEGIDVEVRVGTSRDIPCEAASLDYLVAWWSSYYMGDGQDFGVHVGEFARVLKPGGYFIGSLLQPTHFGESAAPVRPGFYRIEDDPVGIRNGEVLRVFDDAAEIEQEFGERFDRFAFGSQHDDIFGQRQHTWIVVCRNKG